MLSGKKKKIEACFCFLMQKITLASGMFFAALFQLKSSLFFSFHLKTAEIVPTLFAGKLLVNCRMETAVCTVDLACGNVSHPYQQIQATETKRGKECETQRRNAENRSRQTHRQSISLGWLMILQLREIPLQSSLFNILISPSLPHHASQSPSLHSQ